MANGYRNTLVQQIKDAGQELINPFVIFMVKYYEEVVK